MSGRKPARRALASKHTPRGLRLALYAVIWLLMDRLGAPPWLWGVIGTLCVLLFSLSLYDFFTAEDVELP